MKPEWFAGRLRELREAARLTQQELADLAGMKFGGIQNLEQGRTLPSWESVLALAEALGVSVEEFAKEPAERPKPARGRPRKAPGVAPDATEGEVTGERPSEERKRGKRKRGKE